MRPRELERKDRQRRTHTRNPREVEDRAYCGLLITNLTRANADERPTCFNCRKHMREAASR